MKQELFLKKRNDLAKFSETTSLISFNYKGRDIVKNVNSQVYLELKFYEIVSINILCS